MTIDVCEVCGSTNIKEIKCKVVCQNCGTILKTCSDLAREGTELRVADVLRTAD
jgi:transcription initiation factor TFIIIB Brf1 subunit/transcription initiation factor TFIIB